MKKYTFTILGIMFFTIGIIVNPVLAAERQRVYEMGESGQIFSFLMTLEEIAAEDNEKEKLATIREAKTQKPKQRRKIFEMSESGQIVSFPMTADEIVAEDTEIGRLKAIQNVRVPKREGDFVIFELAESGEIIEFPAKGVEIFKIVGINQDNYK